MKERDKKLVVLGLVLILMAIIGCVSFLVYNIVNDRAKDDKEISINEKLVTDITDGIIMSTRDVEYK